MSRYDKYDPMTGGFRAPLAANFGYTASLPDRKHADLSKLFAAGLSNTGTLGKFDTTLFPAFCGVLILTGPKGAGDIVDVMTDGEIVDLVDAEIKGADTLGPGTRLYADTSVTTGLLTTTAAAMRFVGFTVEIGRLVVRCSMSGVGA